MEGGNRNQIENIVKPILYECREKGHQVTATLAAYIAQTIYNEGKASFRAFSYAIVRDQEVLPGR